MGPHRPNARRALLRIARALAQLHGPAWPLALAPPPESRVEIPACRSCRSELVCPRDWGIVDESGWCVRLRCGECEAWTQIFIDNRQAAALDRALARQMDEIRRAADRLDAERMAVQAEAFTAALRRDLIVAADF